MIVCRKASPIPWYVSVLVMALGIGCFCLSALPTIAGLSEVGRALIYIPLGNLFGMSMLR